MQEDPLAVELERVRMRGMAVLEAARGFNLPAPVREAMVELERAIYIAHLPDPKRLLQAREQVEIRKRQKTDRATKRLLELTEEGKRYGVTIGVTHSVEGKAWAVYHKGRKVGGAWNERSLLVVLGRAVRNAR